MEKIPGLSIITKRYLYELMYVIVNEPLDIRLHKILKKMKETFFIDLAFDYAEVNRYKRLFERIVDNKLKGMSSTAIEEDISSITALSEIWNEVKTSIELNKNRINKDEILTILDRKIKTYHILDFVLKYGRFSFTESQDLNDDKLDFLISEINKLYKNIADNFNFIERDYTSEDDIEDRFQERLMKLLGKGRTKVISTGIELLDAVFRTRRGMESGELYIIGAQYGKGKTRFVVRLGANMYLNGANVYHITIENKIEDIEEMYDTALLNISPEEIYVKFRKELDKLIDEVGIENITDDDKLALIQAITKEYKDKLKEIYNSRENVIYFKKYHPYRVSPADIKAWINAKIQETGKRPDVIIVDHMDIVVPSLKGFDIDSSMFAKGEAIAGELKTIAEEFNAILITPTQLNREGVKSNKKQFETGGEATSRSMAKNELTGFLMTLNQTQEEALHNYMRLYINKNRIGIDEVVIPVKFDKGKIQIELITDQQTLMSFKENVRLSVDYLLKRYYAKEEKEFDKFKEENLANMIKIEEDEEIFESYESTEIEDDIPETKIKFYENLKDFIKAYVELQTLAQKNGLTQTYDISEDEIEISISNYSIRIQKDKYLEKMKEVISNPVIYRKLTTNYSIFENINHDLGLIQEVNSIEETEI